MWIQATAIILPRVQEHYDSGCFPHFDQQAAHLFQVSDGLIGTLSSSMFAGMMVGAVGWGTCTSFLLCLSARFIQLYRLGLAWSKYSIQRDPLLYFSIRAIVRYHHLIYDPVHSFLLSGKRRRGKGTPKPTVLCLIFCRALCQRMALCFLNSCQTKKGT